MNAVAANQKFGYGNDAVRTNRDIEYDALSRVNRMIRNSIASGDKSAQILAVDKNNQLWTIFAADLASDSSELPDELRANLLSLAAFSLRHGHATLAGKVSPDVLIDINLSVMKGLRGEVQS